MAIIVKEPPPGSPGSQSVTSTGTGTDNAIARWDGTGTRALQDSLVTIDDTGNIIQPAAAWLMASGRGQTGWLSAGKLQLQNAAGDRGVVFDLTTLGRLRLRDLIDNADARFFCNDLVLSKVLTPGGTTGNITANVAIGTVNFAAGASTLTVTNSLCSSVSVVFAMVLTNDGTATIKNVVRSSGSFLIRLGSAATAETAVGFGVFN